ncbi:E3 ubiquitin-protein ligase ZNRF3 [Euphorbia peplus]|nr:E3 ubiquitin-protein ligase ZNRF3 [Euphorbia peplus]
MVFKKFAYFLYNLIGLRKQLRIKDAIPFDTITISIFDKSKEGLVKSLEQSCPSTSKEVLEVEGDFCCVCLSMIGGEDTRVLPCMHKFHKVCIERWFNVCRKTCPVCRLVVGEEERCTNKREEQLTEEMVIWFSSFHVAGF